MKPQNINSEKEIRKFQDVSKNNNMMKLNIFKNFNKKEDFESLNNNHENFPLNIPIKDLNKLGLDKGVMNINFNNINMPDLHKKYYNNFIINGKNRNLKNKNNIYSLYLKNHNKGSQKSRSTSKTSHNNYIIPGPEMHYFSSF